MTNHTEQNPVGVAADGAGASLLEARGIAKAFSGVPALSNGQLDLRAGSIHALCGGNGAGKSTFLNIVTGILRRDKGAIRFKDKEVDFHSPKDALNAGISIITQELSPILGMTVAENLYLGQLPKRFGGLMIDWHTLYQRAGNLLETLGFKIDPRRRMSELSLAQVQLVEIAKAMNRQDASVLIMDEPTSALGEQETDLLFTSVRKLSALGKGIIYVSHRMTEIFKLCDAYTVFRDGQFVETGRIEDTDRKRLVSAIIGRDYQDQFPASKAEVTTKPLLRVEGLEVKGRLADINLEVYPGEVLGIYGLGGSGRSRFLNTLYGVNKMDRGKVAINEQPTRIRSPRDAIRHGLALVTEDRKATGLVLTSSVKENMSLASLPRLSWMGIMRRLRESEWTNHWIKTLRVKAASPKMQVRFMSGGNQQKVVLARALETEPRLLLLDEPTRGVDAGAKQEIYGFVENYRQKGNGVIMVSSEIDEMLGMSTRIVVFRRGRITAQFQNDNVSGADLLHAAS